jgi:DNA-binding IclR family transcriptional regulator
LPAGQSSEALPRPRRTANAVLVDHRVNLANDGVRMTRVQSIDRAFTILHALSDGPLGVSAIARRVVLPKSSTSRLLWALIDQGAVEQLPDGHYCLGPMMAKLASGPHPGRHLALIARPHLAAMAEATGEIAMIGVPDGRHVVYIDQLGGSHEISVRDWTGARIPMHQTSGGQVLLASLSPARLAAYLGDPLERSSIATITDPNTLRWRLRTIVEAGYAWVVGEYSEGLSSVAAGVADRDGQVACVIGLHGPSFRFPLPGRRAAIGELVAETAARMAHDLRVAP